MRHFSLKDFIYQNNQGIYTLDESAAHPFAYSDGDAAEEYVLRSIRDVQDVSYNSPELTRKSRDWSSYYHLAAGRASHLQALELPQDIAVLELGAGCGAVSRYLGEKHRMLHCVEGSPRRAVIARERCRGLDNVKVYCADFRKIALEPEYDLVLLNGVLEYAPVFFGGEGRSPDEAVAALLRLAKSALTENGVLIIAIENKIGLKYWCGADEDHTGRLFDGIHGYPTPGTARTYSKNELTRFLEAAGFGLSQFYSCFPDYKFATSILAVGNDVPNDYFIHNWIPYPAENPGLTREYLIHEGLAAKTLADAGLIHEFANSFLVVASPNSAGKFERSLKPDWLACKLSVANRDKSVHCITKFFPKTATIEKNLIHYVGAGGQAENPLGHTAAPATWLAGNLLSWEAASAAMSKNFRQAFPVIFAEYHAELLKKFAVGSVDAEGFPLVKGDGFDFIMGNIIRTQSGLEGIDDEWKLDRTLAADYLLYRSLCYDVIGQNKYWVDGRKISDANEFAIAMIRTIYPNYSRKRHDGNRALENTVLREIRGALTATTWGASYKSALWKRAIKALARKLPPSVRKNIMRISEVIHENVLVVFDTAY